MKRITLTEKTTHVTFRKLTHLKARLFFFLPLPRNPLFPTVAWVEFEFELLTVESLSLSSSSNFACFPPLSSSTSDPVPSTSTWGSVGREETLSSVMVAFAERTIKASVCARRERPACHAHSAQSYSAFEQGSPVLWSLYRSARKQIGLFSNFHEGLRHPRVVIRKIQSVHKYN